ncbi:MAG TPA: hypothetical protein VN922_24510, partial [Bacteroidia bacterium]|nr:hypothetical protein [Bacteroidia bacterium]
MKSKKIYNINSNDYKGAVFNALIQYELTTTRSHLLQIPLLTQRERECAKIHTLYEDRFKI